MTAVDPYIDPSLQRLEAVLRTALDDRFRYEQEARELRDEIDVLRRQVDLKRHLGVEARRKVDEVERLIIDRRRQLARSAEGRVTGAASE